MTTFLTELPATIDIQVKQGSDTVEACTWLADEVQVDFTGASARLQIYDSVGNVLFTLTLDVSPYGSVYLGTPATVDPGVFTMTFSRTLSLVLCAKSAYDFFIDWPNGTTQAIATGTIRLLKGSPF